MSLMVPNDEMKWFCKICNKYYPNHQVEHLDRMFEPKHVHYSGKIPHVVKKSME